MLPQYVVVSFSPSSWWSSLRDGIANDRGADFAEDGGDKCRRKDSKA